MQATLTATQPQVGWSFGDFHIDGVLGEGGVATVYRVLDQRGRYLAMKVLKRAAAQQAAVRACFEREYRVAARLSHRGVISALEQGEIAGHRYLTMPTVEGETLAAQLKGGKRLPPVRAVAIVRQLAAALDHIHEQGVVHRDVKPSNILLEQDGTAQLCDFGLAMPMAAVNAADEHRLYGTPLYMAPEQAQPEAVVDGRADLYALGVVLYRMLTGRAPFYSIDQADLVRAHQTATPPCPTKFVRLAPALRAFLHKALAKDPAARFQSGAEFAAALAQIDLTPPARGAFQFLRFLR